MSANYNRFVARVSIRRISKRWIYLGTFPSRWWANHVGRVARRLKSAGELDACLTARAVRERVAAELGLHQDSRQESRRQREPA